MDPQKMDDIVANSVVPLTEEELDRRVRISVYNHLYSTVVDIVNGLNAHPALHPETTELQTATVDAIQKMAMEFLEGSKTGENSESKLDTRYALTMKAIAEEFDRTRRQLAEQLMVDPGFLATFGSDYVTHYNPVVVRMNEPFRNMDEVRFRIEQTITIQTPRRARETESEMANIEAESSLREKVNNLLRKHHDALAAGDTDMVDSFNEQLNELEHELFRFNLRINDQGELESV